MKDGPEVGENNARWERKNPIGLVVWMLCMASPLGFVCHAQVERTERDLPNYTFSWVGNSLNTVGEGIHPRSGHVVHNVDDIFVTPDGTVYVNAEWEESHQSVAAYRNGQWVADARVGPFGGRSVTANTKYLYFALKRKAAGVVYRGINRRDRADIGDATKNVRVQWAVSDVDDDGAVYGLAASETRVFAAVPSSNRIIVYDADLKQAGSWSCEKPGEICLDREEKLWVIQLGRGVIQRYDAGGKALPQRIPIEPGVVPSALCMDPSGRLLVADAGAREQVRIYKNITSHPVLETVFGVEGGVYAGTTTKGLLGPKRFVDIKGIGVDQKGNIYVANGAGVYKDGATLLQSYSPDGALLWELGSFVWESVGSSPDPDDENVLYSMDTRFRMDYTKTVPGSEWRAEALTANRHLYQESDARYRKGIGLLGKTWVYKIQGRKFMFVNNMGGREIHVYRFDPETYGYLAIPCGNITPDGIWVDGNRNGRMDSGETVAHSVNMYNSGMNGIFPDSEGTIWLPTYKNGVYRLPIDRIASGIPVYSPNNVARFDMPAPFTELRRFLFYPERGNLMMLNGFTADHPDVVKHFKRAGKVCRIYRDWKPGQWNLVSEMVPPYADKKNSPKDVHGGDPNLMGMDLAGEYAFFCRNCLSDGVNAPMDAKQAQVEVYRIADGAYAGRMYPPEEFNQAHTLMDITHCLTAYRRSNGEYCVFLEDGCKSKWFMYRWKP
jgi:hypothetical protein